jgi:hypothetical protein
VAGSSFAAVDVASPLGSSVVLVAGTGAFEPLFAGWLAFGSCSAEPPQPRIQTLTSSDANNATQRRETATDMVILFGFGIFDRTIIHLGNEK